MYKNKRTNNYYSINIKLLFIFTAIIYFSILGNQAYAQHFVPAATETEFSMEIVIPADAPYLDGIPLDIGDEIAVFTEDDSCAGMIIWNAEDDTLIAWGDDGGVHVFMIGESISYKIWDYSSNQEYWAYETLAYGVSIFYDGIRTELASLVSFSDHFIISSSIDQVTAPKQNVLIPRDKTKIKGFPLEIGDEIAVFTYDDVCAGVHKWVAGAGGYVYLTVYGGFPSFEEGELMYFRLWDTSEGIEYKDEFVVVEVTSGSLYWHEDAYTMLQKLEAISVRWEILGSNTGSPPDSVSKMIIINTQPGQWLPDDTFTITASFIDITLIQDSVYISGLEQLGYTDHEEPDSWDGLKAVWEFSTDSIPSDILSGKYYFQIHQCYSSIIDFTVIYLTLINGDEPNGTLDFCTDEKISENIIEYPVDSLRYFCNNDQTVVNIVLEDKIMGFDGIDNDGDGLTDEPGEGVDFSRPMFLYLNRISVNFNTTLIQIGDTLSYFVARYNSNFSEGEYKFDLYGYNLFGLKTEKYNIDIPDTLPDIIKIYADNNPPILDSIIVTDGKGNISNLIFDDDTIVIEDSCGLGLIILELRDPLIEANGSTWSGSDPDVDFWDIYNKNDSLQWSRIEVWFDNSLISSGEQVYNSIYYDSSRIAFSFPNIRKSGDYIIKYQLLDNVGNKSEVIEKTITYHYLIDIAFNEPIERDTLFTSQATSISPVFSGQVWTHESYYPDLDYVTFRWAFDSNEDGKPDAGVWRNEYIDEWNISVPDSQYVSISTRFRIKEVPLYTNSFLVELKAFNVNGNTITDTHRIYIFDDQAPIATISTLIEDSTYNKLTFPDNISGTITYYDLPDYDIKEIQIQYKYFTDTTWLDIGSPITYFPIPDTFYYSISPAQFFEDYFYQYSGNYLFRVLAKDVFDNVATDITPITSVNIDTSSVGAIARFRATPSIGYVPLEVSFMDQSLYDGYPIISWEWNFGDGSIDSISIEQNPVHEYTSIGTFTGSLIVTTASDDDTTISDIRIIEPHFPLIYGSNNPYQPMNIIALSAKSNGLDLKQGDEIGVFDYTLSGDTLCVGVAVVDETVTSDNVLNIIASADDPFTSGVIDGFITGDSIRFKIWNNSDSTVSEPTARFLSIDGDTINGIFQPQEIIFTHIGYHHFEVVYTVNPYLPMCINILSAKLNELDLEFGDEIGIFSATGGSAPGGDSDICVGKGLVTNIITPDSMLSIQVSADNPGSPEIDGFLLGNVILLKIWDFDKEMEYTATGYFWEIPGVSTSGIFQGQDLYVDVFSTTNQLIDLDSGWNIVSFNIIPEETDLDSVFTPLKLNVNRVVDEKGDSYFINPWTQEWENNIGNINAYDGYYVSMKADSNLFVSGSRVELPVFDNLIRGWNIIGYPFYKNINALSILDELIATNYLERVLDESGNSLFKWDNNWINNIGNMEPGEGYYLSVNQDCFFTFGEQGKSSIPLDKYIARLGMLDSSQYVTGSNPNGGYKRNGEEGSSPEHFKVVYQGNPYMPMSINALSVTLSGIEMEQGDEIGIFSAGGGSAFGGDESLCVGAAVINDTVSYQNLLCMVASADDPYTAEIDGFISGNPISIRVWDRSDSIYEYEAEVDFWDAPGIPGDSIFIQQGIIYVDIYADSIPYNSSMYWGNVSVFGEPGSVGDSIKVYDPYGILCGYYIIDTQGEYGPMAVACAGEGNRIVFDYIDVSENIVYYNVAVDSSWNIGTNEQIDINVIATTDIIPMNSGWNLISFDVLLIPNNPDTVFSSVMNELILVKGFDPDGITNGQAVNGAILYDPALPAFNTLYHTQPGFGYWVKLSGPALLSMEGSSLDPNMLLYLKEGWNLKGYIPQNDVDPATGLSTLDSLICAKGFDQNGISHGQSVNGATIYYPALPPEFNTLRYLQNGFGYWFKVGRDDTLIYKSSDDTLKTIKQFPYDDFRNQMSVKRQDIVFTPYSEMYYGYMDCLDIGDAIIAFDSDSVMCGYFNIRNRGVYGAMAVYGDDPLTKFDEGANSYEEIRFYYWNCMNDNIYRLKPYDNCWRNREYSRLDFEICEIQQKPTETKLYSCYPNPFGQKTNINYQISKSGRVQISIYNIKGQLVATLENKKQEPGYYKISWDGKGNNNKQLGNGIYFYVLKTDNKKFIKKLLILK